MRFTCLVYFKTGAIEALTPEQYAALTDDSIAGDHAMRAAGHLIMGQPLQPLDHAVTLRKPGGRLTRTDGPFAETKEWLAGFFIIEAADMDQALEIAAASPVLRYGSVEVRPVLEQTDSTTGQARPPLKLQP